MANESAALLTCQSDLEVADPAELDPEAGTIWQASGPHVHTCLRKTTLAGLVLSIGIVAVVAWRGRTPRLGGTDVDWLQSKAEVPEIVCYVDGAGGALNKQKFFGSGIMCLKLKTSSATQHAAATADTCSTFKTQMKTNPAVVKEVSCCTADLCNGEDKEDITCYVDGPAGTLQTITFPKNSGSASEMVCAKYTYLGTDSHVPVSKSTCDQMKVASGTYKDLTCCSTDKCNGPSAAEKKKDLTCYTDGVGGVLTTTMYADPDGQYVCAKFTVAGTTYHQGPMAKSTGDSIKAAVGTYKDVVVCRADKCNGD